MKDIKIYSQKDALSMHKAGLLAAKTLEHIDSMIEVGVSTLDINDECHRFITSNGGKCAPLNYKGFPKSVCTSVNHVVCHGIPNADKILVDGDIINVDVTVILDGWYGDTSKTFKVGPSFSRKSSKFIKADRLVDCCYEAMWKGINVVKEGIRISEIGRAIQGFVENKGYSVVRDYCGHGIGKIFHDEPAILHYVPSSGSYPDFELKKGMFFTIEPMINIGSYKTITSKDGWTVYTRDKELSAQFEHTIGVTSNGCEIFTLIK